MKKNQNVNTYCSCGDPSAWDVSESLKHDLAVMYREGTHCCTFAFGEGGGDSDDSSVGTR